VKLGKRVVDALTYERKSGAQYAWDDDLAGFGVRVYPTGRKSYVVTYRHDGRQRFFTLGRVGPMTFHEARIRALEVLAAVGRGGDPGGERMAYREAPTMGHLADRFIREHAKPRRKPSTARAYEQLLQAYVLPRFGKRKVADITRADVAGLHAELHHVPYQANRSLAVLSKAFNLCEVWGWRPDGSNPCRHIQRYREEKRERFLSGEEMTRFAEAISEAERQQTECPAAIAAIRLLAVTGCRSAEIKKLRWSEVDFERRCLRLGDSKTGRRTVYLNTTALEVLAGIERVLGNPYVIVGAKPGAHLVGLSRPWFRIRERAGLSDVRLHDLRHSFASVAAASGLSLPMIGKLLGHTQPVTTQRYAHLAADPMLKASELVGATIDAAMRGRPKAEVVPFGRRDDGPATSRTADRSRS
jgi:integrase